MSYHSERLELNPTRTFSEMMPNTCPRGEATGIVTYQLPRVIGGGILLGVLIPLHFSLARNLGRGAYCVLKKNSPGYRRQISWQLEVVWSPPEGLKAVGGH